MRYRSWDCVAAAVLVWSPEAYVGAGRAQCVSALGRGPGTDHVTSFCQVRELIGRQPKWTMSAMGRPVSDSHIARVTIM